MWFNENLSSTCGSPKYSSAYAFLISSPILEFHSLESTTTDNEWIRPDERGLYVDWVLLHENVIETKNIIVHFSPRFLI